jgi:2-C-methyl-D-erythritol 4-phosphate cytidylyltransferase
MKYYAIIVAGGSGSRMQTETPKQFLVLQNLPVIMHTIKAFADCNTKPQIILVLNESKHTCWKDLCQKYNFTIPHTLVKGGEERFHSVKNALNTITEESIIAIHDAVRPLTLTQIIDNSFKVAKKSGNAVVAIQPSDSLRRKTDFATVAVDRSNYYLIQTPQTFSSKIIKEAYNITFTKAFTDDASVAENNGTKINLIEGDRNNIKITYPTDLIFADLILKSR